eukprot:SAG31_NODE_2953_length_4866_cov_7.809104_5_plen_185_part_00
MEPTAWVQGPSSGLPLGSDQCHHNAQLSMSFTIACLMEGGADSFYAVRTMWRGAQCGADDQVRSYFLVFVPTIRETRDFYREMQRTNRESITMCRLLGAAMSPAASVPLHRRSRWNCVPARLATTPRLSADQKALALSGQYIRTVAAPLPSLARATAATAAAAATATSGASTCRHHCCGHSNSN